MSDHEVARSVRLAHEAEVKPPIYPKLDQFYDLGLFRISGAGLGNCFYSYFYAYVMSIESGAPLVYPAWVTLKLGPLLRGERSKRFNIGLFRVPPGEISGLRKLLILCRGLSFSRKSISENSQAEVSANRYLTVVSARTFSFATLHPWRDRIRERFVMMVQRQIAHPVRWGAASYIAVHVRLGDFAAPKPGDLEDGREVRRLPLSWYGGVIRRLRKILPELPIHVLSDGHDEELTELLVIDGVSLRRESNDIEDLIALAEAAILVGSHSTFSRWAAFLGNMPTIWFRRNNNPEQPTALDVPILYIGDDAETITSHELVRT